MPKISICCPVYTMKGKIAEKFLVLYFSNLINQTFKDFNVIISDQSDSDNLKQICDVFSHVLDIRYHKNTSGVKNAANNVNNSIRHATGDIIKLLYMDDFFLDTQALHKINDAFESNKKGKWFISGYAVCDNERNRITKRFLPRYNEKFVNGDNSTGNPSNYSVRREFALEMDEDLLWLVDGEYFYRSYYHYGDPIIINDILVCLMDRPDGAFHDENIKSLDAKERQYCVDKFNKPVEHRVINAA